MIRSSKSPANATCSLDWTDLDPDGQRCSVRCNYEGMAKRAPMKPFKTANPYPQMRLKI